MKKEDRRVRMTKLVIKESLIELLQQYPISKISVKMLCETADINRSTFYAHYTDQYDLLKKVQQDAVAEIRNHIVNRYFTLNQEEVAIPALVKILEYAKENQTLLKVLLSENNNSSFQLELMTLAREKTLEETQADTRLPEQKYLEIFEISGVVSILREWLNNDCEGELEQMARFISILLFKGIGGFY